MHISSVGENAAYDHFHMTAHFTVPAITTDEPPIMLVTCARHVQMRVVACGPVFAMPMLDMPYPVPGMPFDGFAKSTFATAETLMGTFGATKQWAGKARKISPGLLPVPIADTEPMF